MLANQDQQITAVIVNRKENLLKKGGGYHLDLLVVAIGIIVNSLLGIPWSTFFSENSPMSIRKTFSTLLNSYLQVRGQHNPVCNACPGVDFC